MKGLKREREEIDKKIDSLTKQRRDELIGDKATKAVIVKGGDRMIITRSQLKEVVRDETTNDLLIINDRKSLHDSDLEDDAHETSCAKCGRKGIELWRKEGCLKRFNNPDVLCLPCLGIHGTTEFWYEVKKDGSSWYPAIYYDDYTSTLEDVGGFKNNGTVKGKFLALPK
jgi:hypothetical protein